jgi:trk system potassium uptake protein TrkA
MASSQHSASVSKGSIVYAIVIGCGRAGAEVANRLSAGNHAVVVIDHDHKAFSRLPTGFDGTTLVGHAIDIDCLLSAGIERADLLIATTYGDNSNLTAVQIASRKFGVDRSIARIKDPIRASIFEKLGVETLSSTTLVGKAFDRQLDQAATAYSPPAQAES